MIDKENFKSNDLLHGITLEKLLIDLVEYYGWRELSKIIEIRCFYNEPSIKSSLKFLRHTPWAKAKVEKLYQDLKWQENKDEAAYNIHPSAASFF
jgi:uncharacterized protein (DUF2132 family)